MLVVKPGMTTIVLMAGVRVTVVVWVVGEYEGVKVWTATTVEVVMTVT